MNKVKIGLVLILTLRMSVSLACSYRPDDSTVEQVYNKAMLNPTSVVAYIEILSTKEITDLKTGMNQKVHTLKVLEGFKGVATNKKIIAISGMHSCGYFRPIGTKDLVIMSLRDKKFRIAEQFPYKFKQEELLNYFRLKAQGATSLEKKTAEKVEPIKKETQAQPESLQKNIINTKPKKN